MARCEEPYDICRYCRLSALAALAYCQYILCLFIESRKLSSAQFQHPRAHTHPSCTLKYRNHIDPSRKFTFTVHSLNIWSDRDRALCNCLTIYGISSSAQWTLSAHIDGDILICLFGDAIKCSPSLFSHYSKMPSPPTSISRFFQWPKRAFSGFCDVAFGKVSPRCNFTSNISRAQVVLSMCTVLAHMWRSNTCMSEQTPSQWPTIIEWSRFESIVHTTLGWIKRSNKYSIDLFGVRSVPAHTTLYAIQCATVKHWMWFVCACGYVCACVLPIRKTFFSPGYVHILSAT